MLKLKSLYRSYVTGGTKKFSRNYCTKLDIQEHCRKFARNILQPVAAKLDETCSFPKDQVAELGRIGLMSITAPIKYGGLGLDMYSTSLAVEELSRGCASTGAIVSIHNLLYIDLLSRFGNEQQKEKYLRSFPGAFALSEANAGTDVANISTTAVKENNRFLLNGCKYWVTSAKESEFGIIFATVDRKLHHRGITAFIVPLHANGVHLSEPDQKLGIRATSTCQISLTDVIVPVENVVGAVGGGFKIAMQQLNRARIGIASQAIGISQASLDAALDYAVVRNVFGKRLVDMQAVQIRLARMAAQIEAARLLVRNAAKLCDENKDVIKASAIAKLMASEAATFASNQCIQIMGGMGYTTSMPAERYYRDARVTELYGGVSDIQMITIAEQLLKDYENRF